MSNGRQMTRARGQQMAPQQRAMPQQQMLAPGTRSGNWMWDGSQWICCDGDFDCDDFPCPPFPCPPVPGFRPWFDPQTAPWYPGANAGVSFGATAPSFPIRGNFWWDGVRLHMFDGAAWVDIVSSAIAGGSGGGGTTGGSGTVIISTTPPGNPVVGEEWWNGSVLQVWDGSTWHTVGPGVLTGPVPTTTIMFGMTCTTNRTVGSSAWTIVPFNDTPNPDPMSAWDSVQHKFTPIKAGLYLFEIRGGGSPTTNAIALLKNDPGTFSNALSSDIIVCIASSATSGWQSVAGVALMNGSTDFVRMWALMGDGIFHNTGSNQIFTAALLP